MVVEVIQWISYYSILVPFCIGLIFLKSLSKDSKIIMLVLLIGIAPQLLKANGANVTLLNLFYNLYSPCEFFLFLLLFRNRITFQKHVKIIRVSVAVYTALLITLFFVFGFIQRFINELACINNLIYTIYISMYLYEQYVLENDLTPLSQSPFFWFIAGILLYAPCTYLVYASWQQIKLHTHSINNYFAFIHSFFNINMYIFFSIGIIKDIFKMKEVSKSI